MNFTSNAAFAAALLLSTGAAQAQGNVAIYGIVDVALAYHDNVAGSSTLKLDPGAASPSRLGLRGREDLGGGMFTVFTLEAGFTPDTGVVGNATAFWSRGSWVGIGSKDWGTVSLGRQIDFLNTDIPPDTAPLLQGGMAAGWQSARGENLDIHYGAAVYNNTIKWKHEIGPVKFGLMYGMGDEVQGAHQNMKSAFVTWESGPWAIGGAWVKDNYVATVLAREVYAIKGMYTGQAWRALANTAVGKDSRTLARIHSSEVAFLYDITRKWVVGAGLGHANVTRSTGGKATLLQPAVGTKYFLGKATHAYAALARNHSDNTSVLTGNVGGPGGALASSSGSRQTALRMGLNLRF